MGKDITKSTAFKSPISSVHLQALLDALESQGSTNDCGPYATASIINGLLGEKINPATLAKEMSKPTWKGLFYSIRRIPNSATFPWGIVDIFRKYGFNARWKLFASQDEIIQILNTGGIVLPILGKWRPLEAHIMTLVAWDPDKGWGFANTQYNHHNVDWWDADTVRKQWRNMGRLLIEIKNA